MKYYLIQFLISSMLLVVLWISKKNQPDNSLTIKNVSADTETIPVPESGDAADDPAIWVNFKNPDKSYAIGSNKKRGLHVYDLSGKEVFSNSAGKINNIDVRYGFELSDGSRIDIVAGSNRSLNSISVFRINENGSLQNVTNGSIKSNLDVSGFCLYKDLKDDKFYAFVNGNSGRVEQWLLFSVASNKIDGALVRSFKIGSQPEGCVCDDEIGALYLGEERKGIWKFEASPLGGNRGRLIADFSNKNLKPDIEGLSLYYAKAGNGYLLASSQGNNTFAVFERRGSNKYIGSFKITKGMTTDGVEESDGIDVINFGLDAQFPDGLFVAHDGVVVKNGKNVNQNFKLISWKKIAKKFDPPLLVDNNYTVENK